MVHAPTLVKQHVAVDDFAALAMEQANGRAGRARAVADYIAGMTDRYAFQEHARITGKGAV